MAPIQDPKTYRELNAPFPDRKTAADAVDAFTAAERELRKTHKIPDVLSIVRVTYLDGEREGALLAYVHHGNTAESLPMLAQAYGAAKREHDALMEQFTKGKD